MRYHFAEFVLDTDRHELATADTPVRVRPKAFAVLTYLIENRDRAVSKDELVRAAWPAGVASDAALASCIKSLRRALADDGREPDILQTVRGHGFRFVAELDRVENRPPGSPLTAPADREPGEREAAAPDPPPAAPEATEFETNGPERERKYVTVLCARLDAIADWEAVLGPEGADERIAEVFELAGTLIERFEGTVTQWLGDGFIALFGVPRSREDHARRAVTVAVALRDAMTRAPHTSPDALSMALHTGPMVIRPATTLTKDYLTIANAVTRTALALRQHTPAGAILLSREIHHVLEHEIHAEPWQPGNAAASADAVLFKSLRMRRAGVPLQIGGARTRFFGRTRELEVAREKLAQASEGRGQLITVAGEPGIGKSRFIDELARYARAAGNRVIEGICLPYATDIPYFPLSRLLRSLLGPVRATDPDRLSAQITALLAEHRIHDEEATLLLRELLDHSFVSARLAEAQPETLRPRTFAYLQELFIRAGQRQPLLVLLDDVQWADATSLTWLRELVEHLGAAPLTVVLAYRIGFTLDWNERTSSTRLVLPPLVPHDAQALARAILRTPQAVSEQSPSDLDPSVLARAEGNPFFIEALARAQRDGDVDDGQLPATVQAVIAARIDQLAAVEKALLQASAVLGGEFSADLLASLDVIGPARLEPTLRALLAAELIVQVQLLPHPVYTFSHALVREVAYELLLPEHCQRLHLAAAQALRGPLAGSDEASAARVAWHYARAGHPREAANEWQRAARQAIRRCANTEALAHLDKAIDSVRQLAPDPTRDRFELELTLMRGAALFVSEGVAAARTEQAYRHALLLAQHDPEPGPQFLALLGLARIHHARGEHERSRELAERLLLLAEAERDREHTQAALQLLGANLLYMGEFHRAIEHLERGVSLATTDPDRNAQRHGISPAVQCRVYAAQALWAVGRLDDALAGVQRARELADSLEHLHSQVLAHYFALRLALLGDRLDRFEADLRAMRVHIGAGQLPLWGSVAEFMEGAYLARTGHLARGIELMRDGLGSTHGVRAHIFRQGFLLTLAEAELAAGEVARAEHRLTEAHAAREETGQRYLDAEYWRVRARVASARAQGDDDIPTYFERAVAIAHVQGASGLERRARADWNAYDDARRRDATTHPRRAPEGMGAGELGRARGTRGEEIQ